MTNLQVFGHRGAAGSAPENTLAGFARAIEFGAHWIELDVQAHPEALVVFHDDTLARCTNGRGRVLQTPLATLRALDAGRGERIPLLEEVLETVQGKARLNIELKAGPRVGSRTAAVLLKALLAGWRPEDLVVSSFQHGSLRDFRRAAPQIPIAPLFAHSARHAIDIARSLRADTVHIGLPAVSRRLLARLRAAGLRVRIFTVNHRQVAAGLLRHGVHGIFTDHPERFVVPSAAQPVVTAP